MSLFAVSSAVTSVASRHLRQQLLSTTGASSTSSLRIGGGNISTAVTRRHLTSKGSNGNGLRRTKNQGRHDAKPKQSPPSQSSQASSTKTTTTDPHLLANEMVANESRARIPGTESVATLTKEQKLSNFAMAAGLLGFVSYIFYYSLASVGGAEKAKALIFGQDIQQNEDGEAVNPGFEEFLKEANEGRTQEEKRMQAEVEAQGEARELVELESSTAARLKAEGVEDANVVGSENEEEEREMARVAGFVDGEVGDNVVKKRPLWKRAVFFWRKE